ncbi:MAG: hypothetical protein JWM98_2249 [Thermoleophilia bacterium]|nr:hypothetical protein [Thermoleophilia bacterium]
MRGIGIAAIGLAVATVGGAAAAIALTGHHDDAGSDSPVGPTPSPSPGPSPTPPASSTPAPRTGVSWNPDDLLPTVAPGGAPQATWAAEVLRFHDASGDGELAAADDGGARGGFSRDAAGLVSAIVERYDTDGDHRLDAAEAATIGGDRADSSGTLTKAASDSLRRELFAAARS